MTRKFAKIFRPLWTLLTASVIGVVGMNDSQGAPITFNTALPVGQGEFIARGLTVISESGNDPSGTDRDRRSFASIPALGYGVTGDLALFGVLPILHNRLKVTTGGVRRTRSATGIGDFSFFGRYTVFQNDAPGRSLRIAPFVGLKTPTGANTETDSLGLLPPSVQLGSGSWDPFAGIVTTHQTLAYQMDAQINYRANTKANGFEFGDVVRFDTSFQYRLWPRTLAGSVPAFVYGVLESNLIYQGKNKTGGAANPNSGGVTWFVVPGLQYVTKRLILEAAVQLPAYQDLNGTALENEYIVRAGFRFNF